MYLRDFKIHFYESKDKSQIEYIGKQTGHKNMSNHCELK